MRQPANILITPSAHQPWYGAAGPDDRYTRQQLYYMTVRGLNPETAEAITVRREATSAEVWVPAGDARPIYEFDCPIVSRRRDGRLNVLAPSGDVKIVRVDGWINEPRGPKKQGW